MRAVSQQAFGGPEILQVIETETPSLVSSEVLVQVKAAGVNPVDITVREGWYPLLGEPPFVLGWDVSGVVVAVDPGVNRFAVGDEVSGMPFFPRQAGAYAEYVAAPARQLARKPSSIDHEHAAALPLAVLTAWQALVDAADVQPGQRVLIHGAGGGVGHLAVQLAKHLGAEVIGTASAGKREFVRGLGADEVIDYRKVDFTEAVRDVDVVLDMVGKDYGTRSIGVLREGGLLVTAVERSNAELAARVTAAGRQFKGVAVEPDRVALESVAALVDSGALRAHVEQSFPLEHVGKAHELVSSSPAGKVVLTL
jgi:NADPH:quinone reductase-like Zn-dependent oxidoreductase